MKKDLTPYERREKIKAFLVKEKSTTVMRLAYLYDVSINTIKRDIVFLSDCIPIETKSGNGGGIFLNMEFDLPKKYLTNDEVALLKKLAKELSDKDKRTLNDILNKFTVPKKN